MAKAEVVVVKKVVSKAKPDYKMASAVEKIDKDTGELHIYVKIWGRENRVKLNQRYSVPFDQAAANRIKKEVKEIGGHYNTYKQAQDYGKKKAEEKKKNKLINGLANRYADHVAVDNNLSRKARNKVFKETRLRAKTDAKFLAQLADDY